MDDSWTTWPSDLSTSATATEADRRSLNAIKLGTQNLEFILCPLEVFGDHLNGARQAPSVGPVASSRPWPERSEQTHGSCEAYKPKSQTTAGALPPADCLQDHLMDSW